MRFIIALPSRALAAPVLLVLFVLGACAPVGYGDVGFTYVRWPVQDEQLPRENLLEVETLLNRLGYLASAPDAAITPETRNAVRRFQTDIGAPANGFISPTLLAALRINAGLGPSIVVAAPATDGVVVPIAEPDEDNEDGRGGGTGGGGGWN